MEITENELFHKNVQNGKQDVQVEVKCYALPHEKRNRVEKELETFFNSVTEILKAD